MDIHAAAKHRKLQLSELEELRLFSYENTRIYKEKIKQWHDKAHSTKELNSRLISFTLQLKIKAFSGKAKV